MKDLLKFDYTAHYNQPVSTIDNFYTSTRNIYFELKDDINLVYNDKGQGVARFNNPREIEVFVLNYEEFVKSLSPVYKNRRQVCDILLHTANEKQLLLCELTDTFEKYVNTFSNDKGSQPGKRNKAIKQLQQSLSDLIAVPSIACFIEKHSTKQCCFFNKQPKAPVTINAVNAFNRINNLSSNGFEMPVPEIEKFGFRFFEFWGGMVYGV